MRCKACDVLLQEHELKRKGLITGDYIDLCDSCFSTIEDEVATEDEQQPFWNNHDEAVDSLY